MAGKFIFKKFSEINIDDRFFDELKLDYPGNAHSTGFVKWFNDKASQNATALVFDDAEGLGAFIYLKDEDAPIKLVEQILPAISRIKIGTLCIASRYRRQRLGEGAIGLALWKWQQTKKEEIYVTVFEKHKMLIGQLERYGFIHVGNNPNGECVYIKSRRNIDYSDPYKAFPFVNPAFQKAGYLIVNDIYHDTLFPYSELSRTLQECIGLAVANGLSKIYIGAPYSRPHYAIGEPILIYRRHSKRDGQSRQYKSCITSYCVVNNVIMAKTNNRYLTTFEELKKRIGNKSVFNEQEIKEKYENDANLMVLEIVYYGFFGAGNNVNQKWLNQNGYWTSNGIYPTNRQLRPEEFKAILREGNIDVSNVIIN